VIPPSKIGDNLVAAFTLFYLLRRVINDLEADENIVGGPMEQLAWRGSRRWLRNEPAVLEDHVR
jgi:hypothetical protein